MQPASTARAAPLSAAAARAAIKDGTPGFHRRDLRSGRDGTGRAAAAERSDLRTARRSLAGFGRLHAVEGAWRPKPGCGSHHGEHRPAAGGRCFRKSWRRKPGSKFHRHAPEPQWERPKRRPRRGRREPGRSVALVRTLVAPNSSSSLAVKVVSTQYALTLDIVTDAYGRVVVAGVHPASGSPGRGHGFDVKAFCLAWGIGGCGCLEALARCRRDPAGAARRSIRVGGTPCTSPRNARCRPEVASTARSR